MRRAVAAFAALALAGCGGDEDRDRAASAAPATSTTTTQRAADDGFARGPEDVLACRTLTPADVRKLLAGVGYDAPPELEVEFKTDTPELSDCRYFVGDEVGVWLTIDRAAQAQKRYWYRLEEQQQRHAPDPRRRPKLVFDVGQDKTYGGAGAVWTPSLTRLYAYRDDTILVIGFRVKGVRDARLREAAADLGRLAYEGLFGDRPPAPAYSLSGRGPQP